MNLPHSSRRSFLKATLAAGVAPLILPSHIWSAETKPNAGINAGPTVPADASRSDAQPPQAAPRKPTATAQPAAPAQPAWPTEVKPIAGVNSGPIVPAVAPRSNDAVARRWLENFDKPASDQAPDKK